MSDTTGIPYGYCHCGCGQKTRIAERNHTKLGFIKGEPIRFCKGHRESPPIEERFWMKVNKTDGCWLWMGGKDGDGYGGFWLEGKPISAHRYSYQLNIGPIPEGLLVLHTCDQPACVNPAHFFLGTKKDNAIDREQKGRSRDSRGEKQGAAKLTEVKVRQIFQDSKNGMSQKKIADKHAIHPSSVSKVLLKQVWAWLWK